MGLTIKIKNYPDPYDCGYISYGLFIMELTKTAYGEKCAKIFEKYYRDTQPLTEEEVNYFNQHSNPDLNILLLHPDCEGKLTPTQCKAIYNAIKNLKMNMIGHNYGTMIQYNMLEKWKDMLLYCAKHRVNMYYT